MRQSWTGMKVESASPSFKRACKKLIGEVERAQVVVDAFDESNKRGDMSLCQDLIASKSAAALVADFPQISWKNGYTLEDVRGAHKNLTRAIGAFMDALRPHIVPYMLVEARMRLFHARRQL